MQEAKAKIKKPTLLQSFIPIIFLICLLAFNVSIWGDSTMDGTNRPAGENAVQKQKPRSR